MQKSEYIKGLRELADYLEKKDFPDTVKGWLGDRKELFSPISLYLYTNNKEDFGQLCGILGTFKKSVTDYSTNAEVALESGFTVKVSADRGTVCTRKVVGTKTVPATERVVEEVPEHEEEIVEWECPESFVGLKGDDHAS